jgi:hypothetical protein
LFFVIGQAGATETRATENGAHPSRLSKNMQEPYITSDTN